MQHRTVKSAMRHWQKDFLVSYAPRACISDMLYVKISGLNEGSAIQSLVPQVQAYKVMLKTAEDDEFKTQAVSAYSQGARLQQGRKLVPGRNPLQESDVCNVRDYAVCRMDAFLDALGTAAASAQVCLKSCHTWRESSFTTKHELIHVSGDIVTSDGHVSGFKTMQGL